MKMTLVKQLAAAVCMGAALCGCATEEADSKLHLQTYESPAPAPAQDDDSLLATTPIQNTRGSSILITY